MTNAKDRGLDPKSLAINFSSVLFFLFPIFIYFENQWAKAYFMAVMITFALTYIIPPRGFLRPHEYSDFPENRPYPRID